MQISTRSSNRVQSIATQEGPRHSFGLQRNRVLFVATFARDKWLTEGVQGVDGLEGEAIWVRGSKLSKRKLTLQHLGRNWLRRDLTSKPQHNFQWSIAHLNIFRCPGTLRDPPSQHLRMELPSLTQCRNWMWRFWPGRPWPVGGWPATWQLLRGIGGTTRLG